jgi:hypothetical protein
MPDVGTELVAAVGLRITYTCYAHTFTVGRRIQVFTEKEERRGRVCRSAAQGIQFHARVIFPCSNEAQNITFISNLTKFKVVPPHLILHMFKVCIDDFSGTNIDNLALLLEGCGRFLLRYDETKQRFGTMASHVAQSALSALTSWCAAGADEAQAESYESRSTSDHVA